MSTSSSPTTMRRITPVAALHPYGTGWTIKAVVTDKGIMHTYKRANEDGCVFNIELTGEEGTQIKVTMFNAAAKKLYRVFEMGKVYFISKGRIKVTDNRFRTVDNDYEMTLNNDSSVEEAAERIILPEKKFTFVPIDQLGEYVNRQSHVDVIGVIIRVAPTTFVKRKFDGKVVPKSDVTVMDNAMKTVTVSLWNNFATIFGEELFESATKCPVLVIKSVKVGAFQGVSLSTVASTYMRIHPDIEEAHGLRAWYDRDGKNIAFSSTRTGLNFTMGSRRESMYKDRVTLSYITSNLTLGEEKPIFFSIYACVTYIKPDKTMSYRACTVCLKKVTEAVGSGYCCEWCQKKEDHCNLRYVLSVEFSDVSGAAQLSLFNNEAEKIIGCSADELEKMKSQDEGKNFLLQLQKAMWVPYLLRVMVAPTEFRNEKRQRITVKDIVPVDFAAESRMLLQDICVMKN